MKGMILAAGLGTRFKPWTDKHPKALAEINGRSLLERNIRYLHSAGILDLIVNVHHFPEQIISAIAANKGWGSRITISDETDEVLETGGGLKKASAFFDQGPFLLMNADILTDMDLNLMIGFHKKHNPLATLAVTQRESSRYFLFDTNDRLTGWENSKTGERKIAVSNSVERQKAFSGIHIISPDIFTKINREGKFSIVDVYLSLAESNSIFGYDHTGSKLVDVGKPEAIAKAEALFR